MGFLDKLREFFSGGGAAGNGDPYGLWLYYRCQRCKATVKVRVDRRNDLNREDDGPGTFVLRKEVMDDSCFQLMRSEVWFDSSYNVVAADVTGGEMITEAEYEAEQETEPVAQESEASSPEDREA